MTGRQAWLEAGTPLTPELKTEIIAAVCRRHPTKADAIRKMLAGIGYPARDPGEEG